MAFKDHGSSEAYTPCFTLWSVTSKGMEESRFIGVLGVVLSAVKATST